MRGVRLGVGAVLSLAAGSAIYLHAPAFADATRMAASLADATLITHAQLGPNADPAGPSLERGPEVVRSRFARIDTAALDRAFRPGERSIEDRLRLDLFPDLAPTMVIRSVGPGAPGAPAGSRVLVGSIEGLPDTYAFLSISDGVVIGDFYLGDRGTFQIRAVGPEGDAPGVHMIREVDESRLNPCGVTADHVFRDLAQTHPNPEREADLRGGGVPSFETIDVAVFYTPAARAQAGGDTAIRAAAASWVEQTNVAYATSFVRQEIRLVEARATEFVELTEASEDLAVLRGPNDGLMDEVHEVRDAYGADIVHLISRSVGVCGIAYLQASVTPSFASSAFGLTVYSCGALTFAHELGHNMGCAHDRQNASFGAYCYSFGYRTPNAQYRTIMSYAPGTRIPRFSSPEVAWAGYTMGVSGDGCPSDGCDNSRTMNNTSANTAAFRQTVDIFVPPGEFDLVSPPEGQTAVAVNATLSWSPSDGATAYDVLVSQSSDMTDPVFERRTGLTSVAIPFGVLQPESTYYWSVVSSNPSGSFTPEQNVRSFTTRKYGDFNFDNIVGATDLGILLGSWGPCGFGACLADINGDGAVNAADLAILLGSWNS